MAIPPSFRLQALLDFTMPFPLKIEPHLATLSHEIAGLRTEASPTGYFHEASHAELCHETSHAGLRHRAIHNTGLCQSL